MAGLLALAWAPAAAGASSHRAAAKVRPRAFPSCAGLVRYARHHFAATDGVSARPLPVAGAPARTPTGAPAPAAGGATGGVSFSTTNNQEDGVDEPDIAKTDGSTIFTVSGTTVYAVAVHGGTPRQVGSYALGTGSYGAQLLLRGSRLIVISGGGAGGGPVPLGTTGGVRAALAPTYYGGQTVVREIDVRDPSHMKLARTMTIDGQFVDGRLNGSTARLVISSTPRGIALASARSKSSGWVPARRFHSSLSGRRYVRAVAPCRAIKHPVRFSGLGMLTILTIDLDRGLWAADSDAMMADAEVVYGSTSSLYLATQRWISPSTPVDSLPAGGTTVIHRFDVTDPRRTTFVASGEVPGYLLNQFSMSEYKGFLRVASTSRPVWWSQQPRSTSQSYVTVLHTRAGALVRAGGVSGLGIGQQIYSVRFLGDRGYVVTFRQIDPLYTLDLSSPTAPRVAGKLELEGYSSYLHPVGRGLLLGIGRAVAPAANEPSGTQIELFDVADASAPKLLARTALGDSSSQVDYDHHAFLFWPPTKLAVLPVQVYGSADPGFNGAIGYRVDRAGIAEVGRVTHESAGGSAPSITRSLVVGSRLFTISDSGVLASSLDALAAQTFVRFTSP